MCHDLLNGLTWLDYADAFGTFAHSGFDWVSNNFCSHSSGRLYVGKIDSNARDDLLCHDASNGSEWIDYADSNGRFNGTDWSIGSSWWWHPSGQLF